MSSKCTSLVLRAANLKTTSMPNLTVKVPSRIYGLRTRRNLTTSLFKKSFSGTKVALSYLSRFSAKRVYLKFKIVEKVEKESSGQRPLSVSASLPLEPELVEIELMKPVSSRNQDERNLPVEVTIQKFEQKADFCYITTLLLQSDQHLVPISRRLRLLQLK